jgi:hypothetical protein
LNVALTEAGLQRNHVRTAIHLGGLHEEDGGHGTEVERALRRGQAQWNTWRGYLLNENIAFAKRCVTFRVAVQLPMLAGLDICVRKSCQLARLEAAVCKKLRVLLRGAAARRTNLWVREQCGVYTVRSILRRKRLLFVRGICTMAEAIREIYSDLPALWWGMGCENMFAATE